MLQRWTSALKTHTTNSEQDAMAYAQMGDAEQKKFRINNCYFILFESPSDSVFAFISRFFEAAGVLEILDGHHSPTRCLPSTLPKS